MRRGGEGWRGTWIGRETRLGHPYVYIYIEADELMRHNHLHVFFNSI